MSLFEVVQAIQSVRVGVVGLDSRRTVVVLRSVDDQNDGESDTFPVRFPVNWKIRRVPRGEVKRHPVTSAAITRVRIDDERAGPWLPRGPVSRQRSTRSRDSPLNSSLSGEWSSQSPLFFFSWVDANHLPYLRLHRLAGPLLSTFCGNGRGKTRDRLLNGIFRGCRLLWIFRCVDLCHLSLGDRPGSRKWRR